MLTPLADADASSQPFDTIRSCLPQLHQATKRKKMLAMDPGVLTTVRETLALIAAGNLVDSFFARERPEELQPTPTTLQPPSKKTKEGKPGASRKRPPPTPSPAKANPTSPPQRKPTRARRKSPAKKHSGSKYQ